MSQLVVKTSQLAYLIITADNQQLQLHCLLFGSTGNQTSCQECVSGPQSCTCSTEVACEAGEDNIVDELFAVQTEAECQNHCQESSSCLFYTWHSLNSFPAYSCILLSSCEDTAPCQGCYSGPQECSHQISTTTNTPAMEGKDSCHNICHASNRVVVVVQSHFRVKLN